MGRTVESVFIVDGRDHGTSLLYRSLIFWFCELYKKVMKERGLDAESLRKKQSKVSDYFESKAASTDELFAMAIYTSIASFSMFTTPEWERFFKKLDYTPPNRKRLAGHLLTDCYTKIKQQVEAIADAVSHIQIVSDGSSNITKERVENISFLVGGISYYWKSTAIGAVQAGADWTVKNVLKYAKEITKDSLDRWTAFSSDTCNTQRSVWKILNQEPGCEHVLSVPCDSHGIQLIFKDLLFPGKDSQRVQIITRIGDFFKACPNQIVSFFSKSDKQLSYVRDSMKATIDKITALISTVPTRWGTQVRQVQSINRASEALKAYAERPDDNPREPVKIKEMLNRTNSIWQLLPALEAVLEPIHTHQKMSESDSATLSKVYPRWIALNAHMQKFRAPGYGPWWQEVENYCSRVGKGGWEYRMEQQLQPIHLAAFILCPEKHAEQLTPGFQEKANMYILEHAGQRGFNQWCQYRRKEGNFNPTRPCWEHFSHRAEQFWEISICYSFFSIIFPLTDYL